MYIQRDSCVASLLMFFAMPGLCATPITVNGTNINEVIKPGEYLSCTNKTQSQGNMVFSLKNGMLEVEGIELENIELIKSRRNKLEENKHRLTGYNAKTVIDLRSGKHISFDSAYFNGGEKVILAAGTTIEIYNSIVKSPEVVFACSALKLRDCFMDTPTLQIKSVSPHSLIKAIQITFNKESSVPPSIHGALDFACNEIEAEFMVLGASAVDFYLAPEAFK